MVKESMLMLKPYEYYDRCHFYLQRRDALSWQAESWAPIFAFPQEN